MLRIAAVTLIAIAGLVLTLALRLGAFARVELAPREAGPFYMVYKNHLGPYHQLTPVIQEVEAWAKQSQVACAVTFGEYPDDPRVIDEDRLRASAGCLVDRLPTQAPQNFLLKTIPRRLYLTALFRGAPSIGPYKAYPRAAEWIHANGWRQDGAAIEMYRILSEKDLETIYYFPISREGLDPLRERPGAPRPAPTNSTTSPREGA